MPKTTKKTDVATESTQNAYLDATGRLTPIAAYRATKPFSPETISWRPQNVNTNKKTALALAYADSRAYYERLDEVFGPENWSTSISITTAPFHKVIPAKRKYVQGKITDEILSPEKVIDGSKVFAVCQLTVAGLGTKTSTGGSPTDDDNAVTSAEAQAFKRACAMLGIGRYLYALDKITSGYDFGQWTDPTPKLPEWALPKVECAVTGFPIEEFTFTNKEGKSETWSAQKLIDTSIKHFGEPLSGPIFLQRAKAKSEAAASAKTQTEPQGE